MATRKDRLNKKDLAVIQNYLAKVAHKWIDIGVQLELDPEYLENFKSNQRSSDRDSLRQMILTWLKGKESVPTWRALCTALRSAAVDESGIANKIEEKHLALVREEKPLPVTEECQDTISISKVECAGATKPEESTTAGNRETDTPIGNIEAGTPTNLPAALQPFPCLNTSGLSSEERSVLSERLLQESLMVRLGFTSLVSETEMSFLQRDISSVMICNELKSSNLLHYKTVAGVDGVGTALGCLGDYWGICEHGILEHLILRLGTHEDQQSLEKYHQDLAEFARRRLFECPVRMFGASLGEAEVAVMVKRLDAKTILYDTTLNQVQIFSAIFKKQMDIDSSEMRLLSYQKDGSSLELEFGVLVSLTDTVFPFSSEKKEKLISLGVWLVSCGDYIFQHKLQVEEDEVDAGALSDEERDNEFRDTSAADTAANEPIAVFASTMTCQDEDAGPHTAICINNKRIVVEVSNSSSSDFKAYKVGRVKGDLLQWKSGVRGVRYGRGKTPQIALNDDGYVVEVDAEADSRISCRVGIVHSSNVMIWTESSTLTAGSNPTVALCNHTAIAAFRRADDAFYLVGTLDTEKRTIAWSTQEHRFLSGVSELAIAANQNGTVVAVYTKQTVTSAISSLYATVGELNRKEKRIPFSVKVSLQSLSLGTFPSVSMNQGNNVVMLSVQQRGIQRKIKYKVGLVKKEVKTNSCDMLWSNREGAIDFAGTRASVAMNDRGTVLVSHSNSDGECFCHIGRVHHETTI